MTTAVEKVNGVGPKTTKYLKTKRVTTVEALIKFGVEKLALAPGFSFGRAEAVMQKAMKLVGVSAVASSRIRKKKPSSKPKSKLVAKDKKEKKGNKEKNNKDKKNKKNKKDKKKSK